MKLEKEINMKILWISAGVSSFISGYLERETIDKVLYIWKERLDIQRELRALEGELSLLKKELK